MCLKKIVDSDNRELHPSVEPLEELVPMGLHPKSPEPALPGSSKRPDFIHTLVSLGH